MGAKKCLQEYAKNKTMIHIYEQEIEIAQKELKRLPECPPQDTTHRAEYELIRQLRKHIKECSQRETEARQACEHIEAIINSVEDPRQRSILQMRYIKQPPETWESIAEKLNYTFEHCHKLHREALKNINTEAQ